MQPRHIPLKPLSVRASVRVVRRRPRQALDPWSPGTVPVLHCRFSSERQGPRSNSSSAERREQNGQDATLPRKRATHSRFTRPIRSPPQDETISARHRRGRPGQRHLANASETVSLPFRPIPAAVRPMLTSGIDFQHDVS